MTDPITSTGFIVLFAIVLVGLAFLYHPGIAIFGVLTFAGWLVLTTINGDPILAAIELGVVALLFITGAANYLLVTVLRETLEQRRNRTNSQAPETEASA